MAAIIEMTKQISFILVRFFRKSNEKEVKRALDLKILG